MTILNGGFKHWDLVLFAGKGTFCSSHLLSALAYVRGFEEVWEEFQGCSNDSKQIT